MKTVLSYNGDNFSADFSKGIDLSIPIKTGRTVNAYYAEPVTMEPYKTKDWIGLVEKGGPVNYRNIFFNPHGHGTHTECYGHIDKQVRSVNQSLKTFHVITQLITVVPLQLDNGDFVITDRILENQNLHSSMAVIIRTLPNDDSKLTRNYSGQNPPYFDESAINYLVSMGCEHLIVDLPSIDRESDGGRLLGHRAFWNYPDETRTDCTITELAYVPNDVQDGMYLLNLQLAPFENDAAPSRPVIFPLHKV